jgi:nucleotide-binding universal stress UspA family protein
MSHIEAGKSMIDVTRKHSDKQTRIILFHVIEDIPNWVAVELLKDLLEKSRQATKEKLQAIANAASIRPDVEIRSGHPYKKIIEIAKEEEVDLIIIASHKPGLQDYFLGSTAANVVRHAPCSVLVVR